MDPRSLLLLLLLGSLLPPHGGHDGPHGPDQDPREGWRRPAAPDAPVHVGRGEHRYRWDADWLRLPDGDPWLGATHGCLATDARGHVYLSAEEGDAVRVYSPEGQPLRSFGRDWGPGLHGLTLVAEPTRDREVLYLAHLGRQKAVKTTLRGRVLTTFEPPPPSTGLYARPDQYRPTSVAVAPDGTVFVADGYGLYWIHRYAADGSYLSSFGGRGPAPHQLGTPHGLWLDATGEQPTLIVADRGKGRLARFALDGQFLEQSAPDLLRRPCHLQLTGDLAAVADLQGRVTLLDRHWNLIAHLGDNPDPDQRGQFDVPPNAWEPGRFIAPHCAHIAPDGSIYVMDWSIAGRVTRLVPDPE